MELFRRWMFSLKLRFVQVAYSSPISVARYPTLAVLLIIVGLVFTAGYFVNQMKSGAKNIFVELLIAALASGALGFGCFFLMLSFGLYV